MIIKDGGEDLSRIIRTKDGYEIKSHGIFIPIGVTACFMAFMGGKLILEIVLGMLGGEPFEKADIFGLAFLCLWFSLVLWMAFKSFSEGSKRVCISGEGVVLRSLLKKVFVPWDEICDYGISYSGKAKGGGSIYDLYFSRDYQQEKNECSKRLRGKIVKISIEGEEYRTLAEVVIPYCRHRCCVAPFIGVDKPHFF